MEHVGDTFKAKEKLGQIGVDAGGEFVVTEEMYARGFVPEAWLRVGVCELVAEGEAPTGPNATAAAIRLAEEYGVDLAGVEGTGAGGRVTAPDVEALIDAGAEEEADG